MVALRDVVEAKTGSRNPTNKPNDSFIYVDVAAVDNEDKMIAGARSVMGVDAPSRARKLIRCGDILVSTVRPNLNAVAMVPSSLDGEVASTGFCVLRANDRVLPEYLFFFVRSQAFVNHLCTLVAGALYPAVSDAQVLDQKIPLPSINDQRRIVDLLSRAEGIVRLRREAQKKAAELIPAIFMEMFGEPVSYKKYSPIRPISDFVARFDGGKNIQSGGDKNQKLRILKVSAVTSGLYLENESKPAPDFYKPPEGHLVRQGDFLFSRANTVDLVGATAVAWSTNGRTLLPDKVWRFVWAEDVDIRYMHALFQTRPVRRKLSSLASGTSDSMRNISQAKLFNLCLPIADLASQRIFGQHAEAVWAIEQQQKKALEKAHETFEALLGWAFEG